MVQLFEMDQKQHILNRVLDLYSRYGIKSITMDDICRELIISKKTLYQVVDDKQDLINQVIDYEMESYREMTELMKLDNLNAIEELIHVNQIIHTTHAMHNPTFYYDLKKYYPSVYQRMMDHKRERMYDMTRENLEKGVQENLYRKKLNPHIIAKFYMATVEMMSKPELIGEEESASLEFVSEIFRYHLHGICNEKGRSFLLKNYEKLTVKNIT